MPELPEVERARKLIADSCTGYRIASVETVEDKIVYTGRTVHTDFEKELVGRTITGCDRKGKIFWMTLSGEGRLPVMHFGMTGMIQLRGQEPTWYRRRPRESYKTWPPRFMKFIVNLEPQPGSAGDDPRSLAFCDGRRLGRLRLISQPVEKSPPVSQLGFDPVLGHPAFEEFKDLLAKKKGTIKGVIMDQAFSAGVGNWVADEILYQARIHPACPVPALSEDDLRRLHHWIQAVPETAVAVNADHKRFPEDWLFRWRWGKGKKHERRVEKAAASERGKAKVKAEEDVKREEGSESEASEEDVTPKGQDYMALPNGKPATIEFIEVGGRTTAVVSELQKMPDGVGIKPKTSRGGKGSRGGKVGIPARRKRKDSSDESDDSRSSGGSKGEGGPSSSALSDASDGEKPATPKITTPRQRAAAAKKAGSHVRKEEEVDMKKEPITPTKQSRAASGGSRPRQRAIKAEPDASDGDGKPSPRKRRTASSAAKASSSVVNGKRGRKKQREASSGLSEPSSGE